LCCWSIVNAQDLPFRDYGVQDGLPQSQATVIWQDSRGYLWIPTRNGLSRFDGIEFVNHYRKDGLPSNFVTNVFEDRNGKIWALSAEGLSVYTGKDFIFYKQNIDSDKRIFGFELVVDNKNDFYILMASSATIEPRIIKFSNAAYSDYSGQYPVIDTLKIKNIAFDSVNDELLILDLRGKLWAWKNGQLEMLSSKRFDYLSPANGRITLMEGDQKFDYRNREIKKHKIIHLRGKPAVEGINTNSGSVDFYDGWTVNRIPIPTTQAGHLLDKEGNLWFSSENNIKRLLSTAFSHYTEAEINIQNTWAIAEDKNGHIWFGSIYNKLVEFDGVSFRERDEYKRLFDKNIAFYKGSRRMSNGDNWFSTSDGVLIWDGKSFSRLKNIPDNTQICYIYEDPDNKSVMLGTEKGLFIIDNDVRLYPEFIDMDLGVIEGIAKDTDGVYWLSGHNGIIRFDGRNPIVVKEDILPRGYTYTIEKDSFDGMWVTSEEGLFVKKKGEKSFVAGLPDAINRSANSISVMDNNRILIGRISDICIIDLKKFYSNEKDYFRIYDKTDGFLGNDCIDNGIIKDRHNRYLILTSGKTVVFDPSKLKTTKEPPKIHITGFYYQTDSLVWKNVEGHEFYYDIPEHIELNRFQNKVQFTFNGISTTNPEKVKFQYRLTGFDEIWSVASAKRTVIYEKLSPGHYVFQVKAINADGVETIEPLSLRFKILPAFWQTSLFLIAIALIVLTAVVLIPIYAVKKWQNKKNEREKLKAELSHLQMTSVLRQFDPHFTFNVISSVGSLIMKGEKEAAYEYITKLSGLLRTVLSDGSLIIKPLSVELDFVRKYCDLQKLRFKGRFDYDIHIGQNIDLQREIPKMTIQTFVENSIKHGFEDRKEGGRVDIRIQHPGDNLEISVTDNGIGRLSAARLMTGGTGNGLKIIMGLFNVMNDNNAMKSSVVITDLENNNIPSGTEVMIKIPDNFRFEFVHL
jgi:ligand-binding sensor domain-containing protein